MWPETTQELTKVFARAPQRVNGDLLLAQSPSQPANCAFLLSTGDPTRSDASSAQSQEKREAPKRPP
jgi:hypothetical protein